MDRINSHIPCIVDLFGMPEETVDDPAPIASDSKEKNVKKV